MPNENRPEDESLSEALNQAIHAAEALFDAHQKEECDGCSLCEAAEGMLYTLRSFSSAVDSAIIPTDAVRQRWQRLQTSPDRN